MLFVYSLGLFCFSCYILGPWYVQAGTPLSISLNQRIVEYVVGVIFILSSMPGMMAPVLDNEKRRKALKLSSVLLFLIFLFLAIIRILITGFIPLTWVPLLLIALTAGGLRLYLGVRKD